LGYIHGGVGPSKSTSTIQATPDGRHDVTTTFGAPSSLGVTRSTKRRQQRILVVDDEQTVREFATRALTGAGYEVVSVSDGPEALQIADQQGPFDLCVVDLRMPLMNGEEVARFLRRADPDVKILYFTGFSDGLFKETLTLSANEAFLDKPAGIEGLLEAVSLLLFGRIRA
jgi:CheY-like chemotaxis protein